jgi:hypothetical protein
VAERASTPHINPIPVLKAWLDEPLEDRVMALVEDPSLLELVRDLIEQYQAAHDALVKIAEGPSDVSPPEIARCALGWPAHGWASYPASSQENEE